MALTRWPTEPPGWLLPWTIWQLRLKQGPRPTTAPAKIPQFGWEFLTWVKWRRANRPPPRPDIIADIPQWAYPLLRQVMIAVPLVPPPDPPPPAQPIPPNSWQLRMPIVYTAHGWQLDEPFRDNDTALQNMAQSGVGTVALQGGQFLDDTGDRVRSYGMDVAVWGAADSRDGEYIQQAEAKGYIPQIEGKYEYDRAIGNLEAGVGAGLSLSIVTTSAGLDTFTTRPDGTAEGESTTVEAERLIAAGCTHAQAECYFYNMDAASVPANMFEAKHRGMHYVSPALSYRDIYRTIYGRQVAVFLAEPMSDGQWQQVKVL